MFLRHLRPLASLAVFALVLFGLSACEESATSREPLSAANTRLVGRYQRP
jgi:hypothetical protein